MTTDSMSAVYYTRAARARGLGTRVLPYAIIAAARVETTYQPEDR
ncbi:hypothetical protein [Micromonospora endolithica]|nr:hypothetical protein [Micromonospora endolithica]TWJ22390.1 hypothetical protein JD76_02505 [Micromonospora endolithica]